MSVGSHIVLCAGGTGGHVFPARALAGELVRRGYRLSLITDRRGRLLRDGMGVDDAGATATAADSAPDIYEISAAAIAGKGLIARIRALGSLATGFFQAYRLLRTMAPAAVIGFGGYASAPTMLAAGRLKLRRAIHEQNAVLGRANRTLAPHVERIALSFARTDGVSSADKSRCCWTGNPVRPEFDGLRAAPWSVPDGDGPLNLLVFGGSQGARILSDIVPDALAGLDAGLRGRLQVAHQLRDADADTDTGAGTVAERYEAAGIRAELRAFFDDMPTRLQRSHLVIARAGASTMAELTAMGRPAVLIPYPHAADDHQSANAARLSDAGGAWMIPQRDLSAADLTRRLASLLASPTVLTAAAEAAARNGIPDAGSKLADMVEEMLHGDGGAAR